MVSRVEMKLTMPESGANPSAANPTTRLIDAMDRRGSPACVGLDPVLERLPESIDRSNPVDAIRRFSIEVVEAVGPHVCCIKVQSACYERWGPAGIHVMDEVMEVAASCNTPVILDAKRGDIGISARHYAAAAFQRPSPPDWVTVNGYLGLETLEPWLDHGGVFVLVRTSNPGSAQVQSQQLADGRTVAESMADGLAALAASRLGSTHWSDIGAVVGATHPQEAESLRAKMPGVIMLVPGIGAQGGRVEDCAPLCGPDGHGAVLTASRSVIYADAGDAWKKAVGEAAQDLAAQTGQVAGLR